MTHHPHVHMIVPSGGIAPSGDRWISSRPAFLLPVRVLGSLFRRLFLARLMALHADEFIRRFLGRVLPKGFHRIQHHGPRTASSRKTSIALARQLLEVTPPTPDDEPVGPVDTRPPCPCCGGHMVVIEAFERWQQPRAPPPSTALIRELLP
jgi:Putative transposase